MQIHSRFTGLLLAFSVLLVFVLAGCSRNPLVGKWSNTTPRGIKQEMQFNSNGTWTVSIANGHALMGGTYKTDQSTLTLIQTRTRLSGINVPTTAQISTQEVLNYQVQGDSLTTSRGGRKINFTREQ